MIGFNINGSFLDLFENTSVQFEINTPIYTGGDPTNIQGSFSFPIKVPLTGKNKALLNNPHRIDNYTKHKTYEGVVFYGSGIPLFKGDLVVSNASNKSVNVKLIVNPFSKIKKKKLAEIVDDQYIVDSSEQMEATVQGSKNLSVLEDLDFAFFPVYNEDWLPENKRLGLTDPYKHLLTRTQNFYDFSDAQSYVFDGRNVAVTPFIKLKYLIYKILETTELSFIDEFFDTELSRLYIYNNFSISNKDGSLSNSIDYKNHLPDMESTEFVKQWASLFFLGIFSNLFDGTITIKSLDSVIKGPVIHNWTSKTQEDYGLNDNESSTPNSYTYEVDSNDGLTSQNLHRDLSISHFVKSVDDIEDNIQGSPVYWYVEDLNTVYLRQGFNPDNDNYDTLYKYFLQKKVSNGNIPYIIKMAPLFMVLAKRSILETYRLFIPQVSMRGVHEFLTEEEENEIQDGIQSSVKANTSGPRLVFYRGMQPTINGNLMPTASNHNININGSKVGDYSLLLNGEDGIIEKWGKSVIAFMENRRTVQRIINLNIADILNFRPENKVRIENMNYFVSKMKITFTSSGMKPVLCTLESVL